MDQTKDLTTLDLKKWKKMRSKAMAIYYGGSVICGLLLTGYFSTMYEYIQQIVGDRDTETYYSIILGTGMLSAVVSSLAASVYYDFTKNSKQACMCSLVLISIGNLLYVLPYSVYLVMIGYAFILCQSIAVAAMVAEVNHIIVPEELTATMGRVCAFRSIGMLIGPCLALAYSKIDVHINTWKLTAGNMPALIYGAICVIYIFVLFSLKNLAKVYDLKAVHTTKQLNERMENAHQQSVDLEGESQISKYVQEYDEASNSVTEHGPIGNEGTHQLDQNVSDSTINAQAVVNPRQNQELKESHQVNYSIEVVDETLVKSLKIYFSVVVRILIGKSYFTIWIVSIVPTYTHFLVLNLINVYVYETLNGGIEDVSYARLISLFGGIVATFIVILLSKYVKDVWMAVAQNLITVIPVVLLMTIPHLGNPTLRLFFLYTTAFLTGAVDTSCDILSTSMIGKIVQSQYQGIGEAVRLLGFYLAYALSGFGTGAIFRNMLVGGCTICAANLLTVILLICTRRRYH